MTQAEATPGSTLSAFELAALAANLAESKKAGDTLILDTGKVSYLADYFVICTADSTAQIRTIADEIRKAFRQRGQETLSTTGQTGQSSNSRWSLLDYGDVVIHVFHRSEREFYQLENFWNHATPVEEDKWRRELTPQDLRQAS